MEITADLMHPGYLGLPFSSYVHERELRRQIGPSKDSPGPKLLMVELSKQ